jgi:restriction system protein
MTGRAEKGIILSAGTFTADARREAARDGVQPIELVDEDMLVEMFEHLELGMKPKTVYEVDEEYLEPLKG